MFVDSISKKVFCELQHSTEAKETVLFKQNMELEFKRSKVSIKSFRGDNGVYKATEFRADLQHNDQQIT